MESPNHDLSALFQQLGLPADRASIDAFIQHHSPLADELALADAPCWSAAQANFLREQIEDDADWAELVDQLDLLLRRPR